MSNLLLPEAAERQRILSLCAAKLNAHWDQVPAQPIGPMMSREAIHQWLARYAFDRPVQMDELVSDIVDGLSRGIVHSAHPRCFGLFNPTPSFPGVLGEFIAAAFNPQLAVWSHAPLAVEIEKHLIHHIATRLGIHGARSGGHFTTGGTEANATGLLMALTQRFPAYAEQGIRSAPGQPVFYVSAECHFAWFKIAHQAGIGRSAVQLVPTDGKGRMDAGALHTLVARDRARGHAPFMAAATAGTTNAGMVDPIPAIAELCEREGLWLHVDAAWGGALGLCTSGKHVLEGINRADSLTIDAHKWLSVPMGAGMLLAKDRQVLAETFRVSASYMPSAEPSEDPYITSMQWSRRFIGLKLFLSLAATGWAGMDAAIARQIELAAYLVARLQQENWRVLNNSPMAVVVFVDDSAQSSPELIVSRVQARQSAWISVAKFEGHSALRACITSFRCEAHDVDALIRELDRARRMVGA